MGMKKQGNSRLAALLEMYKKRNILMRHCPTASKLYVIENKTLDLQGKESPKKRNSKMKVFLEMLLKTKGEKTGFSGFCRC